MSFTYDDGAEYLDPNEPDESDVQFLLVLDSESGAMEGEHVIRALRTLNEGDEPRAA